ncbi:MAG: magnetochrome domain-containing protein [Desulfobacterales bacterium]|nr:magnetochrome domain-containing protein [Desulfobacterales bacterium]
MKKVEYEFCMTQFKPAIAGLAILVVLVLGWTGWHCTRRAERNANLLFAATTAPVAPPIGVKDKMLHPYWGNCSKCHVTVGAGKPISKVMAGPPIAIKDKMPHKYWGNCLLCHKVVDGIKAQSKPQPKAAAANRLTARSLGLKLQTVTAAMMQKLGLANEDGALVVDVAPNSIAARAGLRRGDEIIRMGKTRIESTNGFQAALNKFKPGSKVKMNIYRGNKRRNLFVTLPQGLEGGLPAAATAPMTQNQVETLAEQLGVPKTQQDVARALQRQKQARAAAAVTPPMTQNQVETLAEQLGVPKTQQDVARALQRQKQARAVANLNYGKVAVGAMGPGPGYQVPHQFGASPYFVVFDPSQNTYNVVANPNANDATGRGVQTGQYIVDMGVSNIIAGSFNQNALNTLRTLRVNAYAGVTGSAQSAISGYLAGQLIPVNTNPNAQAAAPRVYYPQGQGTRQVQTIY